MATLSTRLTNAGILYINGSFDEYSEASPNQVKLTTNTLYVSELDEITINGGSIAKRELSSGQLQVRQEFDEFTGAPVVDNNLRMWIDAGQNSSYSGSGSTWTDLSPGQTSNVTLTGSPTFSSIANGGSIKFNGSSQYGVGSGTPLGLTSYTKSVWFRLSSTADNNLISSDTGGHFMYFAGTSNLYCGHTDWPIYTAYASNATFSNNAWYNACLTFDTTNGMTLYVNGVQDSTYTVLKTAVPGTGACNVACFGAAGNLLNGEISQAMVYNRVLTSDEVLQNFNALRRRFGI